MELREYAKTAVPRDVAIQIRAYVRVQWPQLDPRDGSAFAVVPETSDARTFVVLDDEALVSHAEANFRDLAHGGATYRVGGISAVFTYPAYRGGGHARTVVAAASRFLDSSDADLAMLFCGERLRPFYESCGCTAAEHARVLHGDDRNPIAHEGTLVMMRFISARGRAAPEAFERENVYVGERTW